MFFKNKFFYIFGFATFNLFSINNLSSENISINQSIKNNKNLIKKDLLNSKSNLENSLKIYKNNSLKILATNSENLENIGNKDIEIVSDIQFEKDNIFYAQGKAIMYISNAELKGDSFSFNRINKEFVAEGNVSFEKGNQYFEASKLVYNFDTGKGYVNDVYGVLDVVNFSEDIELNYKKIKAGKKGLNEKKIIRELDYINSTTVGLENDFETNKQFNITDFNFEIPSINKWRFKSKKITIDSKKIFSKKIFFSNDPFNKPQFLIISNNFSGELKEDKVKFVGRNNWIKFEDKISLPIGRWTFFDRDPISKWTIGSNYEEKDGVYFSRAFEQIELFNKFNLTLVPNYFIQRSLNGYSKAFRKPNSSILSNKVKNDISFPDSFGLDAKLKGSFSDWDLEILSSLNSLNTSRLSEALRSRITLKKSFNLNSKKELTNKNDFPNLKESHYLNNIGDYQKGVASENKNKNENENFDLNFIDFQIYSVFREKVPKGYEGEEEIYFGNALSVAKKDTSLFNNVYKSSAFIYDVGFYKAKKKNENEFDDLLRNVFAFSYDYKFPLWIKKTSEEQISQEFKYTPQIIRPSIYWETNIDSGIFFYGNNTNQKAVAINTGPRMIYGNLKKNFFDYTNINSTFTYVNKSGESPFAFDDINDDTRLVFNWEQQIVGPVLFFYEATMPLNTSNKDYGKFVDFNYKLGFKRRAYEVSAYYRTSNDLFGIEFKINNFDYGGITNSF